MPFEVFAIRYASVEVPRINLFPNASQDDPPTLLDSYFWILQDADQTIIVDTGYDEEVAAKRDRSPIYPIQKALDALKIDPADVKDVILTHLHFDHGGNVDLFPNATFHLQSAELSYCTGPEMGDPSASAFFATEDIKKVLDILYRGDLNLLNGPAEICKGVSVTPLPGHSPGLQAVRVDAGIGPVVIAGDAVHFYELLQAGLPFPIASDPVELVRSYAKLAEFAFDTHAVLAGHDPRVRTVFPERGPHPEIIHVSDPIDVVVPWILSPTGPQT